LPPDITLAVDTSAAHCAAALLFGDGRLVTHAEEMARGQAERLVPMVEEILAGENLAWSDLTLLAVGTGPGNFTGIRIAVSLVRGLALGLGLPAVGVTGFEALAAQRRMPLWTVIDAPRGQFYARRFPEGAATIIGPEELADLEAPVIRRTDVEVAAFVGAIAGVAALKRGTPQPRPAPFYLRGADAAPPSDPPPVILP
jgi:tRNA threonylcarbamoyladenosine biosynthesis protein TsaB